MYQTEGANFGIELVGTSQLIPRMRKSHYQVVIAESTKEVFAQVKAIDNHQGSRSWIVLTHPQSRVVDHSNLEKTRGSRRYRSHDSDPSSL